jgi:hypothetical protein
MFSPESGRSKHGCTPTCKHRLTTCAGIVCSHRLAKPSQFQSLELLAARLFLPDLSQFYLASFFHFQFQTEPAHSRFADLCRIRDQSDFTIRFVDRTPERDTIKVYGAAQTGADHFRDAKFGRPGPCRETEQKAKARNSNLWSRGRRESAGFKSFARTAQRNCCRGRESGRPWTGKEAIDRFDALSNSTPDSLPCLQGKLSVRQCVQVRERLHETVRIKVYRRG